MSSRVTARQTASHPVKSLSCFSRLINHRFVLFFGILRGPLGCRDTLAESGKGPGSEWDTI